MIAPIPKQYTIWICGVFALYISAAEGFNLVLTGPGALEVNLIAGKLAERAGDTCSIISPKDDKYIERCRALMYGKEEQRPEGPRFVSTGEEIGDALEDAEGIIIACERDPMDNDTVDILLRNAPRVRHICLLTQMGNGLLSAEESLRGKCKDGDILLSVVRAGTLRGGGPGGTEGVEHGLNEYFDNTIKDFLEARSSMGFDKFTLGAKVTPGNPFSTPGRNPWMSSSFEPSDTTTSRITAAQAMLAAIKKDNPVDISLSSEKGTVPLKQDEWDALLSR